MGLIILIPGDLARKVRNLGDPGLPRNVAGPRVLNLGDLTRPGLAGNEGRKLGNVGGKVGNEGGKVGNEGS